MYLAAVCILDGLFSYLDLPLSTSVQHSELRAWMTIGNLWPGLRNRELRFSSLLFLGLPQDGLFKLSFVSDFACMGFSSRRIQLRIHFWNSVCMCVGVYVCMYAQLISPLCSSCGELENRRSLTWSSSSLYLRKKPSMIGGSTWFGGSVGIHIQISKNGFTMV